MAHQDIRDGLNAAMGELEAAIVRLDKAVTWRRVREVLEWLHELEEVERRTPDYWTDRVGETAGQTLGALGWVRGIAHH